MFRPWQQDTLSTTGLAWPSSHAAVAFAAAFVLSRMHPRATAIWLLIGVACALTRLIHNDHFVSDVVAGALIGSGVAMALSMRRAASSRLTASER